MKMNNVFIITVVGVGLILLGIAFYELTIDWNILSDISFILYLALIYLMFSTLYGGSRNKRNNF